MKIGLKKTVLEQTLILFLITAFVLLWAGSGNAETLPDLWIDNDDIEISPAELDQGDETSIDATIHLNGSVNSTMVVGFYYKTGSNFTLIEEKVVDLRGKGGENVTQELSILWKAELTFGSAGNIKVIVDTEDQVTEEDETNNQATGDIIVNELPAEEEGIDNDLLGILVIATFIGLLATMLGLSFYILTRDVFAVKSLHDEDGKAGSKQPGSDNKGEKKE